MFHSQSSLTVRRLRSQVPWRSPSPRLPPPPSFRPPVRYLPFSPTSSHLLDSAHRRRQFCPLPFSPVLGHRFRWAGGVHWRGRLSLCLSASGGRLWRRGPPPATHELPPSTVLLLAASCSAASCDAYPHWFLIRAVWAQRSSLSSTRWPDSARSCRTPSCSMISRGNRCFWHCLSCCPIGFGAG